MYFLKPFLKGKILQSERGVNLILITNLRIIFKKNCPKRTIPSDFVKVGSEILYLFLAEKMVFHFVFFVLFVCLLQHFI